MIQCNSLHMQLLLLPSSRTRCCGLSAAYQAAMVSTLACLPVSHNFAMPEEPLACIVGGLAGNGGGQPESSPVHSDDTSNIPAGRFPHPAKFSVSCPKVYLLACIPPRNKATLRTLLVLLLVIVLPACCYGGLPRSCSVCWSRNSLDALAVSAAPLLPQNWLGAQQQQRRKPKQAHKAQQPLMELPLPRSATLTAQAAPALPQSDDTVEDSERAHLMQQGLSVQLLVQLPPCSKGASQANRAGSPARGNVEAADPDQPAQQCSLPDAPTAPATRAHAGAATMAATEQGAAGSRREIILCTPVAAAAHIAEPMSQRTRAKTALAPGSAAARRKIHPEAVADAGDLAAVVTRAQAGPAPPAGQVGQQGSPLGEAPQQDASCGYNDWDADLEAALRHSDRHALAAAAKGQQAKVTSQNRQRAEATGKAIASADSSAPVRDAATAAARSRSALAAAVTSAAAACPNQPEEAPQGQAASPAPQRPAITPHRAMHWRGGPLIIEEATREPAQANAVQSNCPLGVAVGAHVVRSQEAQHPPAEAQSDRLSDAVSEDSLPAKRQLATAKPAESDCPSGLVGDPSMAFVGLGGLVRDVQGDQGPRSPRQAREPDIPQAEDEPAATAAAHAHGMCAEQLGASHHHCMSIPAKFHVMWQCSCCSITVEHAAALLRKQANLA